MIPLIFVGDL